METKNGGNQVIMTSKSQKKDENNLFKYVVVDDDILKWLKDFKQVIKKETSMNFTYNQILHLLIECRDESKSKIYIEPFKKLKGGMLKK